MLKSSFIANSTLQAKYTSLLTRTGYIDIADGSLTGLDKAQYCMTWELPICSANKHSFCLLAELVLNFCTVTEAAVHRQMQENAQVVNFILYIQIYYSDGIIKSYPSSHAKSLKHVLSQSIFSGICGCVF